MEASAYLVTLRADSERLANAAEGNLDADITTCPGWNMAELVSHLGRVQRWATEIVRTRAQERPDFAARPDDGTDLIGWFRDGADRLVEALGGLGPDEKVWTFSGPAPGPFWQRRQALEAAVHRWDGQHAVGAEEPIDATLAVSGLDEVFDFATVRNAGKPLGNGETLHFHATDPAYEMVATFGANGLGLDVKHMKADAAVRGPISDVYLFAWNRLRPRDAGAELEAFGDIALFDRWREIAAL